MAMTFAAVARPWVDASTGTIFNGLLGIGASAEDAPAKRSSCPDGAIELRDVSVTRAIYRSMLIQKVLPALQECWLGGTCGAQITIQQGKVKPHIAVNENDFRAAANPIDCNVTVSRQPPNSPYLSVLDLGGFNAYSLCSARESRTL